MARKLARMRAYMMSREQIAERLAAVGYVADRELPVALQLMDMLGRPLLLEGEAGVGKTEVAKALAAVHGTPLIRLQCYEGLDQSTALYEWNYQRQLLAIRAREAQRRRPATRWSRTSFPSASCWSGRCWPPSAAPTGPCC